jgi:hypothetical protein
MRSGSKTISALGGGPLAISLPYTFQAGEVNPVGVVVYGLNENGSIQKMKTNYNAQTKTAIFTTSYLSKYVIAYDYGLVYAAEWVSPFSDVAPNAWYFDDVRYVVSNGLFSGTSATTFSPNDAVTRGMLVTVLGRLSRVNTGYYSSSGFNDVGIGQYYAPYVAWAQTSNLVTGVGNGKFSPDAKISRQDLAVILYRYTLQNGNAGTYGTLGAFTDAGAVSDYARNALSWAVGAGILQGVGNQLNPKGEATRAQVATAMHRLAE